jgi:hypothetical protein
MRRSKVIVIAGVLFGIGSLVLSLLYLAPSAAPGVFQVAYLGSTNLAAGGYLGDGTPEFPRFDTVAMGISNAPTSKRVGLFLFTNGTTQNASFSLEKVGVLQDGNWVAQAFEWPPFGWELAPGKNCILPVADPGASLRWRIDIAVNERGAGMKYSVDQLTRRYLRTVFFAKPGRAYHVLSCTIMNGRGEPGVPANGSQPSHSDTIVPPSAAGSRR